MENNMGDTLDFQPNYELRVTAIKEGKVRESTAQFASSREINYQIVRNAIAALASDCDLNQEEIPNTFRIEVVDLNLTRRIHGWIEDEKLQKEETEKKLKERLIEEIDKMYPLSGAVADILNGMSIERIIEAINTDEINPNKKEEKE